MIGHYFHYRTMELPPELLGTLNLFGLIVYGESVAENTDKAHVVIRQRSGHMLEDRGSRPLRFSPVLLCPRGQESLDWQAVSKEVENAGGNLVELRQKKLLLSIDSEKEAVPMIHLASVSRQCLEDQLGKELASRYIPSID